MAQPVSNSSVQMCDHLYISKLCYIQAGKKSLKIPGAINRNTANLKKKRYSLTMLKFLCIQYIRALGIIDITGNTWHDDRTVTLGTEPAPLIQ